MEINNWTKEFECIQIDIEYFESYEVGMEKIERLNGKWSCSS